MTRIGAVAAHFGHDLERSVAKIVAMITGARRDGIELLVLPDASLGGYISEFAHPDLDDLPPGLAEDSDPVRTIVAAAGPTVVCFGYAEETADGSLYNSALAVSGDGVLGRHRKVHQPVGESAVYLAGDSFETFETPLGRMGLLVDYDKTFPEAARTLALQGAPLICCLSAWPASLTDRAARLSSDRQSQLFDLYDQARAAENQVVWVSSNLTGLAGNLRFLGQSKVVGPGGTVLARTHAKGGLAVAEVDVEAEVARSRRTLHHLRERVVPAYGSSLSTVSLSPMGAG